MKMRGHWSELRIFEQSAATTHLSASTISDDDEFPSDFRHGRSGMKNGEFEADRKACLSRRTVEVKLGPRQRMIPPI